MSVLQRAEQSALNAIEWLRRTQHPEGWWAGALRSNNTLWYAAALALDQEPADSLVIQDICDYIESCVANDGGIGPYPGEPPDGFETAIALPLLRWARPDSAVLTLSHRYLEDKWTRIKDPSVNLMRWVFEPSARAQILADQGPPEPLRRIALWLSRRHPTERWNLAQLYPREYHGPSFFDRRAGPLLMRAVSFAPIKRLQEASDSCISITGFDFAVSVTAALRRLANDNTGSMQRLYEFAITRRKRFVYADGSYEWMVCLLADIFFTSAFGLNLERLGASSALRKIEYERGGWLRGKEISTNIFDTGLSVLALRAAGIRQTDPLISQAVAFLKQAASPHHGMWSWSYYPGMETRRRYLDTDDTGVACMALASCGEPQHSQNLAKAANGLLRMQENSGAFSTFGDGAIRPNWCWLSNSGRALQALVASGLSLRHENVARAVKWILSQQRPDGSWIDGWCSRYIYGTAIALEALVRTSAVSVNDLCAVRAINWIVKEQNPDGGWGEDWHGARSSSTAEHTGLAVYALCIASSPDDRPVQAIEAGLNWLIKKQRADGSWNACYFVNFGLGSGFANTQMPVVWALRGLAEAMQMFTGSRTSNVGGNQLSATAPTGGP